MILANMLLPGAELMLLIALEVVDFAAAAEAEAAKPLAKSSNLLTNIVLRHTCARAIFCLIGLQDSAISHQG